MARKKLIPSLGKWASGSGHLGGIKRPDTPVGNGCLPHDRKRNARVSQKRGDQRVKALAAKPGARV